MFACTLKARAISNREIIDALQTELDHYYYDAQVIRLLEVQTFADGSVKALTRSQRGTPDMVDTWYGFHYCEHDERVIIDYIAQ